MDMPITRAAAYVKRNRTTHSWYGDSGEDLMSRSCPNTRTLEDHMRQARAAVSGLRASPRHRASATTSTPIVIRAGRTASSSSSSSSPGPITSAMAAARAKRGHQERPSSAYSYDGGLFISANNSHKDFFVINPEWVSEQETVKKLSSDNTGGSAAIGRKPRRVVTWNSYRRSKSAPPAKYRNPITWTY